MVSVASMTIHCVSKNDDSDVAHYNFIASVGEDVA